MGSCLEGYSSQKLKNRINDVTFRVSMTRLLVKQLMIRRWMSKERVTDGRIDMKFVIDRLNSIAHYPSMDNFGKISLLEDFISELLGFEKEEDDEFRKST